MKIVFVTTQSDVQPTSIGRVLPLAKELQKMGHQVTVFLHDENHLSFRPVSRNPGRPASTTGRRGSPIRSGMTTIKITGTNPFTRTTEGKKRKSGIALIWTMKLNAIRAAWQLVIEQPDIIVIVKPLPENTLAVLLAKIFLWNKKIILDVDDFELFVNKLSSLFQRAAIHASERMATALASHIVVATPFLYDHIHQMVAGKKRVTMIPTGLAAVAPPSGEAKAGLDATSRNHVILYIGSTSVFSGHRVDLLPEILAQVQTKVPDASLMIAGSGDSENELKKQFHHLGLDGAVTFSGRFTIDDVSALVSRCEILIDPIDASIVSRAKSSFRTALALVTGTPIVTSNIGIRPELIPASLHDVFFALPENPTSYAERLVALMNSPLTDKDRSSMIQKSKQYTWEQLAQQYNACML